MAKDNLIEQIEWMSEGRNPKSAFHYYPTGKSIRIDQVKDGSEAETVGKV